MNRERAKELLPIIKAYAEGAEVECYSGTGWLRAGTPTFDDLLKYRIKPSSKPRTIEDGLKEGDVIILGKSRRKVLGVCGTMIFVSYSQNFEKAEPYGTHINEFIKADYKLETEKVKVTLEEIAECKGVDVSQIEIEE